MTQHTEGSTSRDGAVTMEVGREVRFAVVMYGGVSLAIYMNGVAQELLHLVRATAPDPANPTTPKHSTVGGTEAVYRRLGQMLGSAAADANRAWTENDPIRTRFIIDIVAGTSAGGINGIYLAKALANGQKIDSLQKLWVDKGDIAVLLNDKQTPPQSLLNGAYMYEQLYQAFEGMEKEGALPQSPYVDDLDLFVTTTDIRGLPVRLRLLDKVADEKRHRNVFRFRYRSGQMEEARNDFKQTNNTLLAFAARCTSAFPFAFEPMRADDALGKIDAGKDHAWDEFFPMYHVPPGEDQKAAPKYHWSERAFGDGGYLDNKPFSYAIEMLGARRATVPVDRKLIYVEPDPEHIDWDTEAKNTGRPHAISNVNAALSLARYETIREDLERILDRNRLIERVERILSGMERDVAVEDRPTATFARVQYGSKGLRESIDKFGPGYGGYHRLKVSQLTDQLTEMIARVGGFDPDSDRFRAIRYLVKAWRDGRYAENCVDGQPTQNAFLLEFDLAYRLRRLNFVLRKIDQLFCLDEATKGILGRWKKPIPTTPDERAAFRDGLRRLCDGLGKAHQILWHARATIGREVDVCEAVASTGLDIGALDAILGAATEVERQAAAAALLEEPRRTEGFETLRVVLSAHIRAASEAAAAICEKLLDGAEAQEGERPAEANARTVARAYYTSFETYDMIAYPILYSTEVGDEMDPVEVLRISPQDAPFVKEPGVRKLAGTSLGHFGAFLNRGWRANDILWGRMDGAERLITVSLKTAGYSEELCRELVGQAHIAILEETFASANRDQLCQLLTDALVKGVADGGAPEELRSLVTPPPGSTLNDLITASLRSCLNPTQLYEFFKFGYKVNLDLNRRETTHTLGRATRITGKLLEGIANTEQLTDRPAVWLARLGSGVTALVELAVPSGLAGAIWRHLLAFLVVIELVLGVGGFILGEQDVQRFGMVMLGLTLGTWAIAHLLADFVARRRGWRRLLSLGAAAAVTGALLLALRGAWHLPADVRDLEAYLHGRQPSPERSACPPSSDNATAQAASPPNVFSTSGSR